MTVTQIDLPLGYSEQKNPPPRPRQDDPKVIELVANKLLPDMIRWLENDHEDDGAILEDIITVLQENRDEDGYTLAKQLEEIGYDADSQLVEVMDQTSHYIYTIHASLVKEWVIYNGITMKYAVGDNVMVKTGWKTVEPGTITGIYPETAEYSIMTESYNKKISSKPNNGTVYCGVIYPQENVNV